jgi:long-chain acyl-CoA synthetase
MPNTSDYLLENGAADDVAVVDARQSYSYADLRCAAGKLAAELSALGLRPGSSVGILAPNSMFWVAAYLAVMKLDLVAVPFSDKLMTEDLRRNADAVDCVAVLVDRNSLRRTAGAFDGLPVITDEALTSAREPYWPTSTTDPDADAVLMFTSGTTNVPKAVRVTHANIQANTESIVSYLGLMRTDRVLVILPFFYCYGASLLHTHLRLGARVVLCNSFVYPETTLDMLEEEGCTVLAGVPSSFQLLLRATTFAARPLPSLRIVQQAGGKLPTVQTEELLAAKPDARLFVMYGQTEATARLSYLPPEKLTDKMGSIGRGIPGVELRVLGDDFTPVAPGERGEIYAVGANISPGYYKDPAGSASKFTPHGMRTGDLAILDDDGYIFIVDRRDDFIKSWGYRVSSQEVEAAALRLDQLISAAAVGVPDNEAGEAVTLFVTTRPGSGISPDDILSSCRRLLPKHMVPRTVHIIDAMPLNANGKIAKTKLRQLTMAAVVSQ